MSMESTGDWVPRGAVAAIGALLVASLLAVAWVRQSGWDIREPDAPVITRVALRFLDRPDGGIDVLDAERNRLVTTVSGEAGFLRGALRTLARERKRRGLGDERAFELLGRADGRLTLLDPATDVRLDLESFGPQQAGTFASLMAARLSTQEP